MYYIGPLHLLLVQVTSSQAIDSDIRFAMTQQNQFQSSVIIMIMYARTAFPDCLEGEGRDRMDKGKIIVRGKKKERSRPEIAEGVFSPALTTGMHEETASIPLADRWFQDTGGLSDQPSPHPAILSLPATTVAHTEQPQIYSPTEKNTRQIAAFGEKAGVEEMSCWWSCFASCFATVQGFRKLIYSTSSKNKPLLLVPQLTVAAKCTAGLGNTWVHVWRMFVLLGSSRPELF